mmetsp:Transcript_5379/g.9290  ORF Transcript_5379/g.9290 Transcript_5379/m.9290 type:complete len:240 (+) Transcript_5379:146-865(+)|eukprot:CAMPEP_0119107718 /NCGR_PEP_ID=MMETSP1180-20130426/11562_1 /TAXON_ID=3052 ORGANISM="Chlamydomonas cf sp, Strain CCMP681" /NCGR_SAMPLE_ID=MMETSP1180 /ASSEMBLY_ACC=CAM_ASM_000741 /LENGTH=239 /DNA_ID=CAMNT_0007093249 /DNA_START=140 /DNA_END=859 /DNA_ORIENTATION=-
MAQPTAEQQTQLVLESIAQLELGLRTSQLESGERIAQLELGLRTTQLESGQRIAQLELGQRELESQLLEQTTYLKECIAQLVSELATVALKVDNLIVLHGFNAFASCMDCLFVQGSQPHSTKTRKWSTAGPNVDLNNLTEVFGLLKPDFGLNYQGGDTFKDFLRELDDLSTMQNLWDTGVHPGSWVDLHKMMERAAADINGTSFASKFPLPTLVINSYKDLYQLSKSQSPLRFIGAPDP